LLLAVPPSQMPAFAQACHAHAQAFWVIGHVRDGQGIAVLP
jgi:hypothetical protein